MSKLLLNSVLFIFTASSSLVFAQANHKGISFQAVVKLPNGEFPTRSGVTVNARVLSPNDCIIREEQFTGVNLSNGYLNLAIGTGTVLGNPQLTMKEVMDNSAAFTGLRCIANDGTESVGSFDPTASGHNGRKLRINLEIDSIPIKADFNMRSMAFAVNAESLNGKSETDFVRTSTNITQTKVEEWFTGNVMGQIVGGTYNAPTATSAVTAQGLAASYTVPLARGGTGVSATNSAQALNALLPSQGGNTGKYLKTDGATATWETVVTSGGTITGVTAGTGLSGGGTTGTVTLSLPNVGTVGTYTKVTTDAQGRVASGGPLTAADIPTLDASKITGPLTQNIDAANVEADVLFSGQGSFSSLRIYDGVSQYLDFRLPSGGTGYTLKWPNQVGGNGQVLQTDASGNLSWVPMSSVTFAGDVSGTSGALKVDKIQNKAVTLTTPIANDILQYNGTGFVNKNIPTCTAGSYLTFDGTVFSCEVDTSGTAPSNASYTAKGVVQFDTDANTSGVTVTSGVAALNTGTTAHKIVKLDASAKLPVVDGSALTNVNATTLQARGVANTAPTDGQALIWDQSGNTWKPETLPDGAVSTKATLANGKIWIGDTSSKAQEQTVSGDGTLSAAGVLAVQKVQGNAVATTTMVAGDAGKVYKWSGSALTPAWFGIADLKTSTGGSQFANASCSTKQTITWSSLTDSFTCSDIAGLDAAAITTGTIDVNRLPGSASAWKDGGAGKLYHNSGSVGIGTTNPNQLLTVEGVVSLAKTTAPSATTDYGKLYVKSADGKLYYMNDGGGEIDLTAPPSSPAGNSGQMQFNNNGVLAGADVRYDSTYSSLAVGSGPVATGYYSFAVGFGATSSSGSQSLAMGTIAVATNTNAVAIGRSVTAGANYAFMLGHGTVSDPMVNNTQDSFAVGFNSTIPTFFVGPSSGAGTTGNVGIGTVTPSEKLHVMGAVRADEYITTSDARLKSNIQTMEGLELLRKLRGVKYLRKSSGKTEYGVIAQEVERVAPELVSTDPNSGIKAVYYQGLISPLIEAVKDLDRECKVSQDDHARKIASVEAENKELHSRVETLENQLGDVRKEMQDLKALMLKKLKEGQ
ncbi:hypothetical protein D3C87_162300 [compost metagenome]